jgi:hypothetical protein
LAAGVTVARGAAVLVRQLWAGGAIWGRTVSMWIVRADPWADDLGLVPRLAGG